MTRKTCTNQSHVDILLESVCSEYLRSKYNQSRYKTRSVVYPTINNDTVLDLCYLPSYNADAFLQSFKKINGIEIDCENIKSLIQDIISNSMTRSKMPRTRTNSMCYKVKQHPASPVDYSHRLRTRRHTSFVNHFVDTSGDDDSNHVKSMRELRSSTRISLKQLKTTENDTWDSGRPKRTCIKNKRISTDERLLADNRNYYKVEVMTNKLRSSNSFRESDILPVRRIKSSHLISEDSDDDDDDDDDDSKDIPTKFPIKRQARMSKLAILNNEAENFMFPHKDDSSSEEDAGAIAKINSSSVNTTTNSRKRDSSTLANHTSINKSNSNYNRNNSNNNKHEPEEESSMDSTSTETSSHIRKRKRLTQAEAFILDNQRYYKFETPGSRLRYQGSYLSPTIALKNNGEYSTNKHHSANKEKQKDVAKSKLNLDDIKFSFELVPHTESWYKTFQRQDKGEESYLCYSYTNPGFYKPFLLPYEMGLLPPLDPGLCMFKYKEMKRRLLGDSNVASTSALCRTPDSSSGDTFANISSTGEDTKSSEDSTLMPSDLSETFYRVKKRKKYVRKNFFLVTKNPRKSPRQHASTLAILSSFIHQRKRRETHKGRHSDHNASKHNLSAIEEKQEPEPNYEEIAKNIDSMLSESVEQIDSLSVPVDDGVSVNCKPDAIASLEELVKSKSLQRHPSILLAKPATNSEGSTPIRKPGRKKKKNRTGWPNKSRRPAFRKDGSDSRDGLAGSEHENSPSITADSEENEEPRADNNRNKNRKNSSLSKLSNYIENTISQIASDKNKNRNSTNIDKINGDVQPSNKLNGVNDNCELNFRNSGTPKRKEHRESSSDNCAEVVIASVGDKIDCVNVDLDMWENAERVLAAKIRSEAINRDFQFQPIVRVQKLDTDILKCTAKQIHNNSSPPPRRTRPRRMPASPKSSRMLRRPRGTWY